MKNIFKSLLISFLFVVFAEANQGVLITNYTDDLNGGQTKRIESIFLGSFSNWSDGTKVIVGYVSSDQAKAEEFFKEYTGYTLKRYQKYWVKRVFSGYGTAPKIFKDTKEAVEFAKSTPGSIVYLPEASVTMLEGSSYLLLR